MGSGVNSFLLLYPLLSPPTPHLHTQPPNHLVSVVEDERRNELLQAAAAAGTLHAMPRKVRAVFVQTGWTQGAWLHTAGCFRHTLHGLLSLRLRRRRKEVIH